MTEPKDEFYIDEQAAAATPAAVEAPKEEFIDTVTKQEEDHDFIVLDAEDVKLVNGEEAGFALVTESTPKPKEQILLFGEFSELYRQVAEAVEAKSHEVAARVSRKAGQFVIGTMVALGLAGTTAKPAEAFDWKGAVQNGVSIAGRISSQHFEKRAREHAEEARFLAEAPRRVRELQRQISRWDGMIENAMSQLEKAKTERRKETIEGDISGMRYARAERIHELEGILHRLEKAGKEGRTAETEMERAQRDATKSQVSATIAHEAEWAHINWGWNTPF